MTDETTTEQLAEIDRDMADIERQVAELVEESQQADYKTQELPEYTPPEGWRVLQVGEVLREGDMWVWPTDDQLRQTVHIGAVVGAKQRYIRPIEPQPQPEPEPQPAEYTPPEGWRVLAVGERLRDGDVTVGRDGSQYPTERVGGWVGSKQRYIRPIESQPQSEPEPQAATIEELRSEVSYVQRLLGESNRKVAQLEDLVGSLRTINEAQEKAFEAAGQHNSDLQSRLNAVCSEWVQQAETIRRLQIELDAAQQVPADSPELRQLRADLAEVTRERDQYLDSYQRIFGDLETIRETTKAAVVEAIAEWLQPIRAVDNEHLANETLQHLPQIIRHLTGLDSPEDVD